MNLERLARAILDGRDWTCHHPAHVGIGGSADHCDSCHVLVVGALANTLAESRDLPLAQRTGRVDGSLSQDAQSLFPGALVWDEGEAGWFLDRPGRVPVVLGSAYGFAKQALYALLDAEKSIRLMATPVYKDFGFENGWREVPDAVAWCRTKAHPLTTSDEGLYKGRGSNTRFRCDLCMIEWHCDSSD